MHFDQNTRIDLHVHTIASDGSWDVEQLIHEVKQKGLGVFAVCDHDTTASVIAARILAKREGLVCVHAVEATSFENGREYHLLGYNYDMQSLDLQEYLLYNQRALLKRDEAIIAYLESQGEPVSAQEFRAFRDNPRLGGFPGLNYLRSKGLCQKSGDFSVFKKSVPIQRRYRLKNVKTCIQRLHQGGATVILAHPSYHYREDVMPKRKLDYFVRMGIDGIECYSTYNPHPFQIEYYKAYCREHGLLISGGSDCHGPYIPTRHLGEPPVTLGDITLFSKLAAYRFLDMTKK